VREVYNKAPPVWLKYDFITIKGQKGKMSSSKGDTITLREVLKFYTPEVTRFIFAGTRPDVEFAISFDVDIFKVYEDFDTVERKYFAPDEGMNEKDRENARRIYELSILAPPSKQPLQPSFRHLATYVQLAEGNLDKVVSMMSHEIKDAYDEARVRRRAACAWNWVREHAPEQYRFTLAVDEPYAASASLPENVKAALRQLAAVLAGQDEETLTELFRQIAEQHGIQTSEFFAGAYKAMLGKDRGPKLASLITQTGHERVALVLGKV
jgi:lysyl-tRNA synthetase class 1